MFLFAQSTFDQLLAGETVGSAVVRAAAVLLTGIVGIYLMLPRGGARQERQAQRLIGGALCTVALALLAALPISAADFANGASSAFWPMPATSQAAPEVPGTPPLPSEVSYVNAGSICFFLFAAVSLISAVMMITARNPVYSALWFALVLLSNSGLYFLQGAEFLAAATIIIYAGAIIVTFLFVIMLAQTRGAAFYDRRTREPAFTCVAGLLLSSVLVGSIHFAARTEGLPGGATFVPGYLQSQQYANARVNAEGEPRSFVPRTWVNWKGDPHVRPLGQTLYLDHVVSVEVIALLLLAAVVGAMLITGHKMEERKV